VTHRQAPLFALPQAEKTTRLTPASALREAQAAFHAHMLAEEWSEHTVPAFDSDLNLLARFAGANTPLGTLHTRRLEEFLAYLRHGRGVPCKPKSLERRVTALKVFFAWLAQEGAVAGDPAAALIHHTAPTPLARILSDAEVASLLAVTDHWRRQRKDADARPHLLITLLLATGIKKGECMHIALSDLDTTLPAAATVFVRYASAKQRLKERRLRLPAAFPSALQQYLTQYQPRAMLFECTARNLEYVLDASAIRAGLPKRIVSFESLRWTCAVRDLRGGMAEDDLRRKLGLSHITWAETAEKLRRLTAPAL
jgi:integrase/recombinase XerD